MFLVSRTPFLVILLILPPILEHRLPYYNGFKYWLIIECSPAGAASRGLSTF